MTVPPLAHLRYVCIGWLLLLAGFPMLSFLHRRIFNAVIAITLIAKNVKIIFAIAQKPNLCACFHRSPYTGNLNQLVAKTGRKTSFGHLELPQKQL